NLTNNAIKHIDASVIFRDSERNLEELYLDFNKVRILTNRCFGTLFKLQLISFRSNPLALLSDISFYGSATLKTVASTRAYLCCIVPAKITTCSPTPDLDSASSCENILAHISLRLAVWIMGIAAFIGNILVIAVHRTNGNQRMSKATELVFSNLALSDFLMSLYLFIIGAADVIYRDRYAQHAEEWLSSPACFIASFLISTSSLMSVIMMLFISIDRYAITANPFASSDERYKRTKIALIVGWLLTCTFVGIPNIMSINQIGDRRLHEFSSICSPSNLSETFFSAWTFTFVIIQLFSWTTTLIVYAMLLVSVRKTQRSVRSSAQSRNFAIAIRLSLILITDLIAWLPVYVISAMAIIQGRLNIFTLQFAVILAIPLNSAINPYIYTATGTACFNRLVTKRSKRKSVQSILGQGTDMSTFVSSGTFAKRGRTGRNVTQANTLIQENRNTTGLKAINTYSYIYNDDDNSTLKQTVSEKADLNENNIIESDSDCLCTDSPKRSHIAPSDISDEAVATINNVDSLIDRNCENQLINDENDLLRHSSDINTCNDDVRDTEGVTNLAFNSSEGSNTAGSEINGHKFLSNEENTNSQSIDSNQSFE
ncbi:G-protein coupled receptor GRL101-like protein, partial [Trichoplax sp. H2]